MSIKSSSSPAPLRVELRASLYLRGALGAMMVFAIIAVTHTALPWWVRVALVLFVSIYGFLAMRRHIGFAGAPAYTALVWNGSAWLLIDTAGEQLLVLRQATLWPGLIALDFVTPGARRSRPLLLSADSAHADDLRQLRIYLRHCAVFEQ